MTTRKAATSSEGELLIRQIAGLNETAARQEGVDEKFSSPDYQTNVARLKEL